MRLLEQILALENLQMACDHLQKNGNSCGIDGMRLSELPGYLSLNAESLCASIRMGKYEPDMVQEVEVINAKGKIRTISKLTAVDRLILRAINRVLYDVFSADFSLNSHGFQENKGVETAVQQVADYLEQGFPFVVDVDIKEYFDSVDHLVLLKLIKRYDLDENLLLLLQRFLKCRVIRDFEIVTKSRGLIQGSPLSPLLSNLYLHELDLYFDQRGISFCRYADDVKLFVHSLEEGVELLGDVQEFLEEKLHLSINEQKSGVFPAIDRLYLGYRFYRFPDGKIEIKKEVKKQKENLYNWRGSGIQRIGGDYHLVGDGILTSKDYNLLFENPVHRRIIPVHGAECLNLYSSITFSSDFFHFIGQNAIQLNLFDKHGEFIGAYIPKQLSASATLTIQQALIYADPAKRLEVAKQFAVSAAHNLRENLKYYQRHVEHEVLSGAVESISRLMQEEKGAEDVESLMLLEARIRGHYYGCINIILPRDDFTFEKRTRQPPLDPINSLISFGNTVLYRRIAKEIYKSRLDIRIGFLHATNRRWESLNLDVAEVFRPVIVDRTIFHLVNRHMLNEKLHFDYLDKGAVYLNQEGKKIFIAAFEDKWNDRTRQKDGVSRSYGELVRQEIHKLIRFFEKSEPYKAYKYFL